MANPIVVFRVGYMKKYDGPAEIRGGGSHIVEHEDGGEMWNFRKENGRVYGYVMSVRFGGINLRKLDPSTRWKENELMTNVDVVFVSTKPGEGQVIIGWYRNATVFHRKYRRRAGSLPGDRRSLKYVCEVAAKDAVLLPEKRRDLPVPTHVKGFIGQSNVWYPDENIPAVRRLVLSIRQLMGRRGQEQTTAKKKGLGGKGWVTRPDRNLIARIESLSTEATIAYFKRRKYRIKRVEKDNRGWDIEARRGREVLFVEIKGHLKEKIWFELTPNEYAKLQEKGLSYRVCVVRNALVNQEVEEYRPMSKCDGWALERLDKPGQISLKPMTAARASER
jgi:hypothetical protein